MAPKPLVHKKYKLERFPGKGGWTYATIPEILKDDYVQWVYSAKKEETKIDRLAKTVNRLAKGLKLYDPSNPG